MKKYLLITIGILALLSGCRQYEELVYFSEMGDENIPNRTLEEEREYRIRSNDILYLRVLSSDPKINAMFQVATQGSATTTSYQYYQEETMYYTGYSVREDGMIDIPVLGVVPVKGKTVLEAQQLIREKAHEYIRDAEVTVKLANFKVTLLGEVNRPGIYNYYNNQTTILEALGKAGDLTDYGNRNQVLIIRPTVEGSRTYRINLQDKELLASAEYFIQPNDVIYVPPLKAKGTRLVAQDYGIFITTISSTLTAISLILTIILNFTSSQG